MIMVYFEQSTNKSKSNTCMAKFLNEMVNIDLIILLESVTVSTISPLLEDDSDWCKVNTSSTELL